MIRNIFVYLSLGCLLIVTGCGGGTRGSGGEQVYRGLVLSTEGAPLSSVSVTIVESGDQASTNQKGEFQITAEPLSGTVNFLLESVSFSGIAASKDIPEDATSIFVQFLVGSGAKPTIAATTEIRETRPQPTRTPTPPSVKPTKTPDPSTTQGPVATPTPVPSAIPSQTPTSDDHGGNQGSGGDDDNGQDSGGSDDDDSHGGSGTPSPTPNSSASPTPNSSATPSDEGKVIDTKGRITSLSPSLVVVNGNQFVPNAQTEYKGKNGSNASLSDFKVNDLVKARGRMSLGVLKLERLEFE